MFDKLVCVVCFVLLKNEILKFDFIKEIKFGRVYWSCVGWSMKFIKFEGILEWSYVFLRYVYVCWS